MLSIGEKLRNERTKRNMGLDRISHELKISIWQLQAMEADRFDRLPGGVFRKSFVQQYARMLGLDDHEMSVDLQKLVEPVALPDPSVKKGEKPHIEVVVASKAAAKAAIKAASEVPFKAETPAPVVATPVARRVPTAVVKWTPPPVLPKHEEISVADRSLAPRYERLVDVVKVMDLPVREAEEPVKKQPQPFTTGFPWRSWSPAAMLLLGILAGSGVYAWWQGEQVSPQSPKHVTAAVPSSPAHIELAKSVVPAPDPRPQPRPAPIAEAPVRVQLTAVAPVWVLARQDGKVVFSGTLKANDSRLLEANDKVFLQIANAANVAIQLNGKPLGPIGSKGKRVTAQFTSGGLAIVSAATAAPLIDLFDPL